MERRTKFSTLPSAPKISLDEVVEFLVGYYGFPLDISTLTGEKNIIAFVVSEKDRLYVLKIFSDDGNFPRIEAEARVMDHLHRKYPEIYPEILQSLDGGLAEFCVTNGEDHYSWVMEFRRGTALGETPDLPRELLRDIGRQVGLLTLELNTFDPTRFQSKGNWAPHFAAERIEGVLDDMPTDIRPLLEQVLERYRRGVKPFEDSLPKAIIHNDLNDGNILIERRQVAAIIDFGDMLESYRVCELANLLAYTMLNRKPIVSILAEITGAYIEHVPLSELELEVLIDFILLRLALSLTLSYIQQAQDPDNPQLSASREPVKELLERLLSNPDIIEACRRASIKFQQ